MADTFTNDLRLRLQESGANSGQWGTLLNTTISNIASAFSLGSEAIPNASTHTITLADGTADEARSMYLKCTGGGQACTVTLAPNTISKVWIISNETSATLTFSQGSGANVAIAAGAVKVIVTDGAGSGAAVVDALSGLSANVSDLTTTGSITTNEDQSGLLTLGRFSSGTPYSLVRPSTNATGLEVRTFAGNALARFLNSGVTELYHNGSLKLSTGANGIGIGTSSPSALVDLGTSTGQKLLMYASSNIKYGMSIETSEYRMFAEDQAVLTFGHMARSDGLTYTQRMRITTSGVGIGCTPSTQLHVQDTGVSGLTLERNVSGAGASTTLQPILFGGPDSASADANHSYAKIDAITTTITNGSESGDLRFFTSGSGTLAERTRITSAGVGIGGIPTATLHVFGGGILGASSTNPIAFTGSGGSNAGIGSYNANTDFNVYTAGTGVFKVRTGAAWSSAGALTSTGTERARFTTGGQLLIGTASGNNTHSKGLRVVSGEVGSHVLDAAVSIEGNGSDFYAINFTGPTSTGFGALAAFSPGTDYLQWQYRTFGVTTNIIRFTASGSVVFSGQIYNTAAYNQTTSFSANMYVNSSGRFFRSTSSQRYKNTIQDATHGLTELLTLRPVTYKGNDDGDLVFGGLIAEEVHDAGLTEFVQYDEDDQPDALAYGNMVSLCIKAIQQQQATITALTARIETLEQN
jgi:hypothetical protein